MPQLRAVIVILFCTISAAAQSAYFSISDESSFQILSAQTGAGKARFVTGLESLNFVTSPDRTIAYLADQSEGVVVVVSLLSGKRVGTLGPAGVQPAAVAISPDGSTLYSANLNNTISIIDVASETTLKNFSILELKPDRGVISLVVTPDGTKAYVGANTFVVSYDLITGARYSSLGLGGAQRIALSPSGDRLFVAARIQKKLVDVVDTATDLVLFSIPSNGQVANDVAISADGSTLYIAASNGLTIASPADGTILRTVSSNKLKTIALSPDGTAACAVSYANPDTLARFDLVSNTLAGSSSANGEGAQCAFSADGKTIYELLAPDDNVTVESTIAQTVTQFIPGLAGAPPSLSGDGTVLVEPGTNYVRVFDTRAATQIGAFPYVPALKSNVAVSKDGTLAFVPSGTSPFSIQEFNLNSGSPISSIPLTEAYNSEAFTALPPGGKTLFYLYLTSGNPSFTLNLCAEDVATASILGCRSIQSGFDIGFCTRAITVSGDGTRIYLFYAPQSLGEFDSATLTLLRTVQVPSNFELSSLVFSRLAKSLYLTAADTYDGLGTVARVDAESFTIAASRLTKLLCSMWRFRRMHPASM